MVVIDIKTGNFFYSEIVKQYVDFDGGTGGGVPQPEGIGFAKSKYPEGFGVNYHDKPHGSFQGRFTTAAEVLYWGAYWGADGDVWLDLGRSRWVKAEHYNYWYFQSSIKVSRRMGSKLLRWY